MRNFSSLKSRVSRGFTLIEIAIVLAIGGMIIFFAVQKMQSTSDTTKANAVVTDLSSIVTKAKALYATQTSYTGVTIAALRDNGVFPTGWNVAGTITSPWTGAVTTAAATFTTAGDALTITIPNVPSGICSDMIRTLSAGIEQITVAGTVVKANGANLNIATMGTQCVSAANVAVAFTFGRI